MEGIHGAEGRGSIGVKGRKEVTVGLELADRAGEAEVEAEADASAVTGHVDGSGGSPGVDEDIGTSGDISSTGDGGRGGGGGHRKDLTFLLVMLVKQHEEAGDVGGGLDGIRLADGGIGILEVDLDDDFVDTFAGRASSNRMGEVLAGGTCRGVGGVAGRRSDRTRGDGDHGGGGKSGVPLVVFVENY